MHCTAGKVAMSAPKEAGGATEAGAGADEEVEAVGRVDEHCCRKAAVLEGSRKR
jgi:hypothetical protein